MYTVRDRLFINNTEFSLVLDPVATDEPSVIWRTHKSHYWKAQTSIRKILDRFNDVDDPCLPKEMNLTVREEQLGLPVLFVDYQKLRGRVFTDGDLQIVYAWAWDMVEVQQEHELELERVACNALKWGVTPIDK